MLLLGSVKKPLPPSVSVFQSSPHHLNAFFLFPPSVAISYPVSFLLLTRFFFFMILHPAYLHTFLTSTPTSLSPPFLFSVPKETIISLFLLTVCIPASPGVFFQSSFSTLSPSPLDLSCRLHNSNYNCVSIEDLD